MNEPNSFLATLQRHRGGALLAEASNQLAALVAAVHATGKPGSVTIKLDIRPATRGRSAVVLKDKVTPKLPSIEAEESFWFATENGALTKDDPQQSKLPFEPVAVPGGVPVVVDGQAARAVNG